MDTALLQESAFPQKGGTGFQFYICILQPVIPFLENVLLVLCIPGFVFEDGEFSALVDGILKKYAYSVFCKTFYVSLKIKIHEDLLCHRLYNENFEFA